MKGPCSIRYVLPPAMILAIGCVPLFLLLLGLSTQAEAPKTKEGPTSLRQFVHAHWEANSDLPVTTINAMAQDQNGYLWLGTPDGLIRFDGVQFTLLRQDQKPGFVNHNIKLLMSTKDGSVWIGTEEAGLMRMKNGAFTHYGRAQNLEDQHIYSLAEGPDGTVYIGTREKGLFRLKDDQIEKVSRPANAPPEISAIHVNNNGTIYVGSENGTLAEIGSSGYRRIEVDPPDQPNQIKCIIDNHTGGLFIGTRGSGISELIREGDTKTHLLESQPKKLSIPATMAIDQEGALWVGDDTYGLSRLSGGVWSAYKASDGLSYDTVKTIIVDQEGNVWAGTQAGMDRFYRGPFTPWVLSADLPSRRVTSLALGITGDLWMGMITGGLGLKSGDEIKSIDLGIVPPHELQTISPRAAGGVWVGTSRGLAWADESGLKHLSLVGSGSNAAVMCIHEEAAGILWVGTETHGLLRIEPSGAIAIITSEGLPLSGVRHLAPDPAGGFWLATQRQGVVHVGKDRRVDRVLSRAEGLGDDSARHVFVEKDGVVWAGLRDGGMTRIEGTNLYNFSKTNGFPFDRVSGIIDDNSGNLWMTTRRGVVRANTTQLGRVASGQNRSLAPEYRTFNQLDGLSTTECELTSAPTVVRGADGQIYIANRLGICSLNPTAVGNSRPEALRVQIESISVDSEPVLLNKAKDIPPSNGKVRITYTVPVLRYAKQVRVESRLVGHDDNWSRAAATTREVYYAGLPPGSYTFEVRAAMPDDPWPKSPTQFAFALQPYFYQTFWFYPLLGIGLVSAGIAGYRLRLRDITARSHELESEVTVRTSELRAEIVERKKAEAALRTLPGKIIEAQEGERQRVSMELHDSVNQLLASIRFRVQYIMAALPQNGALYEAASKTNDHLRHALDEVRRISRNLRPSELDDFGLNSAILSATRDFRERHPEVRLDLELTALPERLPREVELVVYRIVQEALTNIEKHSKASLVKIYLGCHGELLQLEIADNGMGFNFRPAPGQTLSSGPSGIGLSSIQQRAASAAGKCTIWSAPEQGTMIRIEIPLASHTPAVHA